MRLRWPFKRVVPPKTPSNGQARSSEEARRVSEQKLRDAVKDTKEVHRVTSESKELIKNDKFAEALERSMRRPHG